MADLTTPALPRRRRATLNPRVAIGGAGLLLLVGCAVLAPLLAPHDPLEQDLFSTLLPPSWLAGVQVTFLIGGTVLVERIFSYEGIGNMAVDAMINRDLPLIQGLVLTFAVIFIALNLAIDLFNGWLDPRLQHG